MDVHNLTNFPYLKYTQCNLGLKIIKGHNLFKKDKIANVKSNFDISTNQKVVMELFEALRELKTKIGLKFDAKSSISNRPSSPLENLFDQQLKISKKLSNQIKMYTTPEWDVNYCEVTILILDTNLYMEEDFKIFEDLIGVGFLFREISKNFFNG